MAEKRNLLQEEILHPSAEFLRGKGHNITSQFGEDGFIAHALEHLREKGVALSGWCFEVGAGDGRFYSNTLNLRRFGWKAVLIESDEKMYRRMVEDFRETNVWFMNRRIDPFGACALDTVLAGTPIPSAPDLGVIDIDGQDYECWRYLWKYQPTLILIEYAPDDMDTWPAALRLAQRNAADVIALGGYKGYLPLIKTYCNLLFARKDVWLDTLCHTF